MGLQANYMMMGDEALDSIVNLKVPEIVAKIEELEEAGNHELLSLYKMWDVIHCYLTNVSAGHPIEGNKLSESIVGIHFFNNFEEGDSFVTCTEYGELEEIIKELEKVNFKQLREKFDFKIFEENNIYPPVIWLEDREPLIKEIEAHCVNLIKFYKKAVRLKKNIIVSIY